jgi:glucokinase
VGHPLVAAVDLGGTRVKSALVDRDGTEVVSITTPTPPGLDAPGALVGLVHDTVTRLLSAAQAPEVSADPDDVMACGLVVPGLVDDTAGVALWSANLCWRDLPVSEPLGARLGLPVALGHDVRAGLLAEVAFGAARGHEQVLFMPVGTGIAGAMMLDGHVVVGDGWAGELGHVVVEPDGPLCGCGARGCLEAVASASAVERRYAALVPVAVGSPSLEPMAPGSGRRVSAHEIANRVVAGEPAAREIWEVTTTALARALVMVVTLTGVDLVLLGGGLAESGDLLLEPVRRKVTGALTFQRPPRIERATLGDRAGCLGAACLAWELV